MTKGKPVFAWNDGDIKKQEVTYSHEGSTKHWCRVKGVDKVVAFDNVCDLPPPQITRAQAQRLILELSGNKVEII